jgi:hypothetical protein
VADELTPQRAPLKGPPPLRHFCTTSKIPNPTEPASKKAGFLLLTMKEGKCSHPTLAAPGAHPFASLRKMESSDPRSSVPIRGKFLPLVFRADQCYPCKSVVRFCFPVFSASPRWICRMAHTQKRQPACRAAVFPTKERPQSAVERHYLLHINVLREAIKLAVSIPCLDHHDMRAPGSVDRLVERRT